MQMKTNKEVLGSLLKTTQMGQTGIRSVLDKAAKPELRKALQSQLREYDAIETEAHAIAAQKGWTLPELSNGVRMMSDMMTQMKLGTGPYESKIADMMIQGNTKGVVKSLQNLHHYSRPDERILALSQKLLDTEQNNISQMQKFL